MPRRDGLLRRRDGVARLRQVSARSARRAADSPLQRSAEVQAMATASDLFASASDAPTLLHNAATVLANRPGAMCLVSVTAGEGHGLRPFAVAHEQPHAAQDLQQIVADSAGATPVDAFSRTVQRSGGSLRIRVGSPETLRLWLPAGYWTYVERTGVRGVLAAALARRGQVLGTLLLWREHGQAAYAPADQAFVSAFAGRLAQGLSFT